MATVLAVLTSGRKEGFTAKLLGSAIEGIESASGVTVDYLHTHEFSYGPCKSCFECVRGEEHVCVQDDDFGRHGEGEVFRRVSEANALLIADPVHNWSASASARLFIERLYPMLWSGKLDGMPAASISCGSSQGMQLLAAQELCKWFLGFRMRSVGHVATHVVAFDTALLEARVLGQALGRAAATDASSGRRRWSDAECFAHYATRSLWSPLEPYIANLTEDTMMLEGSIMTRALAESAFQNPEAIEDLKRAQEEFRRTLSLYHIGETADAAESLAKAAAYWTGATWREFLEEDVIRAPRPKEYRPIPEEE